MRLGMGEQYTESTDRRKRSVQVAKPPAEVSWVEALGCGGISDLERHRSKPVRRNDLGKSSSGSTTVPMEPLGRRATVLVVDDEELVRCVTQELLGCMGYDAVAVTTGEEAVELVRGGLRPDLVLLDVVMPGMGGIEAFRKLRELVPGIPVLLSSGFTDSRAAAELMDEGLNGIITKPYRMESLSDRIKEVIG